MSKLEEMLSSKDGLIVEEQFKKYCDNSVRVRGIELKYIKDKKFAIPKTAIKNPIDEKEKALVSLNRSISKSDNKVDFLKTFDNQYKLNKKVIESCKDRSHKSSESYKEKFKNASPQSIVGVENESFKMCLVNELNLDAVDNLYKLGCSPYDVYYAIKDITNN